MNEHSPNLDLVQPVDDVRAWIEQGSSVMLKALTRHGDPVELTAAEARAVAEALSELAARLDSRA